MKFGLLAFTFAAASLTSGALAQNQDLGEPAGQSGEVEAAELEGEDEGLFRRRHRHPRLCDRP